MFKCLDNIVSPDTVITTEPVSTITTVRQAEPPTRFGATRIVIKPDPQTPVIQIYETRNSTNHNDYVVYISQCILNEGNYYAELITLLKTLTSASKVVVYIGSPGGSLYSGAMIASAIRNCKAEVTTVAIGVVASAAALIWSYGKRRIAMPGSMLMFHMSSHGDYGNSAEIKIRAENTVRYVKEIAIDPLVAQGLLTAEEAEIIIDRRRDLYLDSDTINARLEIIDV